MTWVWRYYKQVEGWLSSPCTLSSHDSTQFEKSSLVTPVSTLKQISSPPQSSTLHLSWMNLKSYSNSISEINCAGKNESPEWLYWIPKECRAGDTEFPGFIFLPHCMIATPSACFATSWTFSPFEVMSFSTVFAFLSTAKAHVFS